MVSYSNMMFNKLALNASLVWPCTKLSLVNNFMCKHTYKIYT